MIVLNWTIFAISIGVGALGCYNAYLEFYKNLSAPVSGGGAQAHTAMPAAAHWLKLNADQSD